MLWLVGTLGSQPHPLFFLFPGFYLTLLAELKLVKKEGKRKVDPENWHFKEECRVLRFYTFSTSWKTGGPHPGLSRSASDSPIEDRWLSLFILNILLCLQHGNTLNWGADRRGASTHVEEDTARSKGMTRRRRRGHPAAGGGSRWEGRKSKGFLMFLKQGAASIQVTLWLLKISQKQNDNMLTTTTKEELCLYILKKKSSE